MKVNLIFIYKIPRDDKGYIILGVPSHPQRMTF